MPNREESIAHLESRYRLQPHSLLFSRLADAYRKNGDTQMAIDLCTSGLEQHPSYATGYLILGRCLLEKEDLAGAIDAFIRVCQLDRSNAVAIKMLADIFVRQENHQKGSDLYHLLLAADPGNQSLAHLASLAPGSGSDNLFAILETQALPVAHSDPAAGEPSAPPPSPSSFEPTVAEQPEVETLLPATESAEAESGSYEVIETVEDLPREPDADITGDDISQRMSMLFTEEGEVAAPPLTSPQQPQQPSPPAATQEEPEISGEDVSQRIDQLFTEEFSALELRQALESSDGGHPHGDQAVADASLDTGETIGFDRADERDRLPLDDGDLAAATIQGPPDPFVESGRGGDEQGGVQATGQESSHAFATEPAAEEEAQTGFEWPQGEGDETPVATDPAGGADPIRDDTRAADNEEISGEAGEELVELNPPQDTEEPQATQPEDISGEDIALRLDTIFGADEEDPHPAAESAAEEKQEQDERTSAARQSQGDREAHHEDPADVALAGRLDDLFPPESFENDLSVEKDLSVENEFSVENELSVGNDTATSDPFSAAPRDALQPGGEAFGQQPDEAPRSEQPPVPEEAPAPPCVQDDDPLLADYPVSGIGVDQTVALDLSRLQGDSLPGDSTQERGFPDATGEPAAGISAPADEHEDEVTELSGAPLDFDGGDPALDDEVMSPGEKELLETSAINLTDVVDATQERVCGQDVADRLDLLLQETGEGDEENSAGPDSISPDGGLERLEAADTEALNLQAIEAAQAQEPPAQDASSLSAQEDIFSSLANRGVEQIDDLPDDDDDDDDAREEFYAVTGESALQEKMVQPAEGLDVVELETPLAELAEDVDESTGGGAVVPPSGTPADSADSRADDRADSGADADTGVETLDEVGPLSADAATVLLDDEEMDAIPEDAPEEDESGSGGFYTVGGDDAADAGESGEELAAFETVDVDAAVEDVLDEVEPPEETPVPLPAAQAQDAEDEAARDVLSGIPDHVLTPTLADIYYQQGQVHLAAQIFGRLLQRDPDNTRIGARLAALQAECGAVLEAAPPAPAGAKEKPRTPAAHKKEPRTKETGTGSRRKRSSEAPLAGVKIKKKYRERLTGRKKKSS